MKNRWKVEGTIYISTSVYSWEISLLGWEVIGTYEPRNMEPLLLGYPDTTHTSVLPPYLVMRSQCITWVCPGVVQWVGGGVEVIVLVVVNLLSQGCEGLGLLWAVWVFVWLEVCWFLAGPWLLCHHWWWWLVGWQGVHGRGHVSPTAWCV